MAGAAIPKFELTGVETPALDTLSDPITAIDKWLQRAAPGDEVSYHHGHFLPQTAFFAHVRSLIERGHVIPIQRRREGGSGSDYRLVKRANVEPLPLSAAQAGAKTAPRSDVEEECERIMAVLRRLASRGLPCPTNRAIADMAHLSITPDDVRYRLSQLVIGERIRVVEQPQGPRIVTIIASGRSTAKC